MKKNLIALAVLAAAGAASAQSSVTLYGRLDAGLVNVKDQITPANNGQSTTKLDSNVLNNSLWGMKGSEDLGGGLQANFVLEQGFSVDDGAPANAGRAFHRQATVGLSGNFGKVDLGRNYPAYDSIRTLVNNTADTNMAVTTDVFSNGGDYTSRTNNSIRFDSAVYNGFSGAVSYGFGENKDMGKDASGKDISVPGNKSTDQLSLHVKYVNGPVVAAYAYLGDKQADGSTTKYNLVGGAYDFGVVRLNAGYNNAKRTGSEDKEYQVGVSAPFGATTVYFGYANSKTDPDVGATVKRSGFDLAATYALSKRTTAYAGYKTYEIKDANKEATAVGVGIRHVF